MFSRSTIRSRYTSFRGMVAGIAACSSLLALSALPSVPAAHAGPTSGTWTQQLGGTQAEVRDFSRTDANHLWASGSYGRVMRTTDGGQTWMTTSMPDPVMVMHSVKFVDNEVGWTGGEWHSQGVLLRSTDGGATWQSQNEPTGQRIMAVEALDRQTVMVVGGGTYHAITRRSTDGGATWADMPVPLNDSMFLDIFFLDANIGWITGLDGGIARTTDGGVTWQALSAPATYGLESIHFSDANNGWAGGYYGALLHTTNGGNSWVVQNPVLPDFTHVLGVAAVSPSIAWIAGYGGGAQSRPFVKKTTDGGNTWVNYTPVVGPYDGFGPVMFLDEDNGWAGGYAGIFRRIGSSPVPSATATLTRTATSTPSATPAQSTPQATAQASMTPVATRTQVATATATATTQASTPSPESTNVATRTATPNATSTRTPQPGTPTAQATAGQTFSDVLATDYFYVPANWLASHNIVSGYADGTFRPYNLVTRGQLAKIVVLGEGWALDTTGGSHFSDVPATHAFSSYVETALRHGAISGYADGTFRPGADVTRGQLSKIIVSARGWSIDVTGGPHFSDVAADNAFYGYVETAAHHGVLSGYGDGTFRPGSQATRGQIAKIIYLALNGL
jgi:photosystem II stability/assembly factor-like uncharacterized protein